MWIWMQENNIHRWMCSLIFFSKHQKKFNQNCTIGVAQDMSCNGQTQDAWLRDRIPWDIQSIAWSVSPRHSRMDARIDDEVETHNSETTNAVSTHSFQTKTFVTFLQTWSSCSHHVLAILSRIWTQSPVLVDCWHRQCMITRFLCTTTV